MHVKTYHVRWEYSYSRSLSTYKGGRSLEKHDFWRPLEPHKRSLRPQQSNVRRRSWPCRGHRINWINWIEQEPLLYHNYHCSSLLISSISSIYAKDMPKICQRYAKDMPKSRFWSRGTKPPFFERKISTTKDQSCSTRMTFILMLSLQNLVFNGIQDFLHVNFGFTSWDVLAK